MSKVVIAVENLFSRNNNNLILKNFSCNIHEGEVVALIGANGAGKSTLLKTLVGLQKPASGNVKILSKNIDFFKSNLFKEVSFFGSANWMPIDLSVNFLFQIMKSCYPNFKEQDAKSFLLSANIKLNARPRDLTEGQKVQLYLALILFLDTNILILDEPIAFLDLAAQRRVYDTIIKNYLKSNKTVVISSHQIHEIEKLITRVIFIFNGENKLDILVDELKNLVLLETIDPCFSAKIKPKYAFISNNK